MRGGSRAQGPQAQAGGDTSVWSLLPVLVSWSLLGKQQPSGLGRVYDFKGTSHEIESSRDEHKGALHIPLAGTVPIYAFCLCILVHWHLFFL